MPLQPVIHHPWDLSPQDARALQRALRARVAVEPLSELPRLVAGVDVSVPRGRGVARAAAVVLELETLQVIDQAAVESPLQFPYIPGLLSFREAPAILAALDELRVHPEVLLVDGHGWAHPRRFGLACHLGVLLDLPAIGCAKSILVGSHLHLAEDVGSTAELVDEEEVIGAAVRTRQGVKPVYVSIGHRVDLPTAVRCVLACGAGVRLPEPTRLADRLAGGREIPGKIGGNFLKSGA